MDSVGVDRGREWLLSGKSIKIHHSLYMFKDSKQFENGNKCKRVIVQGTQCMYGITRMPSHVIICTNSDDKKTIF